MVYQIQTTTFRNTPAGELRREVMAWLKKAVKFNNERWPGVEAELLTNFDGAQGDVHLKQKFESIAAAQSFAGEWYQDADAQSLMKELHEIARRFGQSAFSEDIQHHYYNIVDLS